MVLVCHRDASMLFDPRSTYSYVSSYFAPYMDMTRGSLDIHFYVSTPIGDSIMVDRVYRSCVVTIKGYETRIDLLLLNMIHFEVIFGIDWLSSYHTILDYHSKIMALTMLGLPRLERRYSLGHTYRRVISFMKAQQIIEKGCLAYLAFVRDTSAETPTVDSVPVVREFLDVFPADLPVIPPDEDIDFGIDLVPGTQPISIPPYYLAPAEVKELKEQ
ncbi:uncharacterized protein [Nicotiana tomentosiformis]|uniref:uncharacterized protein n=1 Tax=Nicotiana tomentosiformis TaxID=4098 RepID=UPI00388C6D53